MKGKAVSGLMLILALILVVVFSTFQMFTSQVKAEYGYADFESGFDGWEPFTVSHVSMVQISTAYAHSGTHSVEMYANSYDNDTIGPGGGIKLPVISTSELYELTAWVYVTERSDGHAAGLFGFRVGGEKVGWNPWASHSSYVWVRQSEGYQQKGSLSNPIPYGLTLNTWHKVSVRLDSTLGTISVLLDDTLIVDPWPAFNAGEKPTDWDIHCWANYYGNFVMHQYVDDVEVLASTRKITILSPQNKTYATTSIPLTFTVNESTSWMGYSLDDQANVTISGNTTLTDLTEGSHSVVVYANDTSGNTRTSAQVFFTVELPVSGAAYLDDFNDGNDDGWTAHLGAWDVVDGEYYMDTLGDANAISTVDHLNLTDCVIETRLRFADTEVGFRAGIVFRDKGDGHFYAFEISNEYDRAQLWYYAPETPPPHGYHIGQNPEYVVQSNVDYALKVEVKGNTFKGYVNGVEVVSATDGNITQGKVGLRGRRADVFFDNFAVSPLHAHAIRVLSPQNKAYATASVPLTFTVNETASWMGYSLDGQANVSITGNTTLTNLMEGSHNVVVYANNTAGTMWASIPVYFTVDITPPTISVLSPENTTYTAANVPLTFTVSESTSWIGYSLDDQANVTISGNATLTGLAEGAHSVVVYVKDAAGNFGASNKVFFTVELPLGGPCAIGVEPSKTIVALGQIVTATITITNITDCAGIQLWIDYDSALLEMVSWTFDTDPVNPLSPTQMAPSAAQRVEVDHSVPGSVKLATVWKAGVPTYSGSGVAAEITFQALTAGNSTLVFDQYWTKAVNSVGEEILFGRFDNPAWVFVTLPGDVDGDRDVDVGDQRRVQLAMFSEPGDPNWDPNMDIDSDLDVDVGDQRKQQLHMFESW